MINLLTRFESAVMAMELLKRGFPATLCQPGRTTGILASSFCLVITGRLSTKQISDSNSNVSFSPSASFLWKQARGYL